MILGFYALKGGEKPGEILEYLDSVLYPVGTEKLRYIFYDRACVLVKSFRPSGVLQEYVMRWSEAAAVPVRWRVDEFHFLGHSPNDQHCRYASKDECTRFLGENMPEGFCALAGRDAAPSTQSTTPDWL